MTLTRLRRCTGWSALLLFAIKEYRMSQDVAIKEYRMSQDVAIIYVHSTWRVVVSNEDSPISSCVLHEIERLVSYLFTKSM